MNHSGSVKYKGKYIHAIRRGTCKYEEALAFWREVVECCKAHNCYNILCESYIACASVTEGFAYTDIFPAAGMTSKHRLAYVYHVPEAIKDIDFIETVLKNRGLMNGYLFTDVDQAQKWLLNGDAREKDYSCLSKQDTDCKADNHQSTGLG